MVAPRPRPGYCIFCGGGNLTDEDAISKWIGRLFARGGNRRAYDITGKSFNRSNIGAQLIVHRVVCRTCNNGWMSRLQTAVKPFLEPMIHGEQVTLGPWVKTGLTAWAVMTAMVLDFAELHMPGPVYTQGDRTSFFRDHLIPRNSSVWLAHRAALSNIHVVGWTIHGISPTNPVQPGPFYNFYTSTGVFGHLVLQLLSPQADANIIPLSQLGGAIETRWKEKHLWLDAPPSKVRITWPPPFPLKEAEIDAFVERWTTDFHRPPP